MLLIRHKRFSQAGASTDVQTRRSQTNAAQHSVISHRPVLLNSFTVISKVPYRTLLNGPGWVLGK